MRNRSYTQNNPCYKSKIQYHLNKVNNLVNCAPSQKDPVLLLRHLNSLNHFVTKQAEIQQNEINNYNLSQIKTKMSKDYLDKWEERAKQNTEIIKQQQNKS